MAAPPFDPGAPSPAPPPPAPPDVEVRRPPRAAAEPAGRVPPHNLDAETSVLGSMLLSRDAIADIGHVVRPEDFYRGAHRTIFEVARDLYDRGEPVDAITLADALESRGVLEDVGGPLAITDLLDRTPTAANALYYARIVADHALRRRLIDVGTQITKIGFDSAVDADEAVDSAEQKVFEVAQRTHTMDFTPMKVMLEASWERIERLHDSNTSITGLATGFGDFDDLTAGLQPGNLVMLAARPGVGKSTFVMNVATNVAVDQRRPVVFFSLEMAQMELVDRILAAQARVDLERLKTGRLQDADWQKLARAMGQVAEAPLFIDDSSDINLMEIRSKCRRLKQKHGLDLVIIDYLQLMQSHRKVENRVQEVSEISRGVKVLAKELDVPVIALSQLSRRPEERTDRRPQLSDLRESGSLEQDSDIVMFIYRDELYDPDTAAKGEAELIVAKHRSGPTKTIRLSFLGHHSRFANMARGPLPPGMPPSGQRPGIGGGPL